VKALFQKEFVQIIRVDQAAPPRHAQILQPEKIGVMNHRHGIDRLFRVVRELPQQPFFDKAALFDMLGDDARNHLLAQARIDNRRHARIGNR